MPLIASIQLNLSKNYELNHLNPFCSSTCNLLLSLSFSNSFLAKQVNTVNLSFPFYRKLERMSSESLISTKVLKSSKSGFPSRLSKSLLESSKASRQTFFPSQDHNRKSRDREELCPGKEIKLTYI